MIGKLTGRLIRKAPDALLVDVHGVGYRVAVSLSAFAALPPEGMEVSLAIHTHMRETSLELFGFVSAAEQGAFGALITVSGIGPRMALNILSGVPASELMDALATGDTARLVAVPGIGKRTAERMIVELREQMAALREGVFSSDLPQAADAEAVSALVNLGYRPPDAQRAIRAARARGADALPEVITLALRILGT
jgi:Holliday junction DNA helicase RuvA